MVRVTSWTVTMMQVFYHLTNVFNKYHHVFWNMSRDFPKSG